MQPPEHPSAGAGRWVSTTEARRLLRMSEGTLRRAIEAGTVRAELRRRNPDSPTDNRMVYEVWIPEAPNGATAPESASATEPATEPPDATTRALEVLAEAYAEERAERQRLAVENAELREDRGRLAAERDAEAARADGLAKRLEAAEWRWWHRWTRRS